jgi:pimeloyl-ACP methyl ester carboxylesterase
MLPLIAAFVSLFSIAAIAPPRKAPGRDAPTLPPARTPVITPDDIGRRDDFWKASGRKFHAGEPGKPAVLLFHGLHRDIRCWTNPADDEGVLCYTYREQPGKRSLGTFSYPGVGIYKVGITDRQLQINENNFFDYLASKGFTVGAFSQKPPMIADAMETAAQAYDAFLAETAKINPAAPPPVCLLGHSRGGLVIRQLLKDRASAPRVKWAITLHSPHGGSDIARTPAVVEQKIREKIAAAMPQIGIVESDIGKRVEDEVIAALRPLFVYLDGKLDAESRELAPDSDFMKSLTKDEKPVDGVEYFTFGGTQCNYMRLYYWTFTAESAKPQYKVSLTSQTQYFKWEVVPHEITDASPIYAGVAQKIMDEVTGGTGDGLV